ncbi:MAG: alkaline phosphatase family protein [Cyclobacteriaceae bacterium]|nr:alkaline phosphatase family protein [Cyclobacteriaceae bacterium]
MLRLSIRVVLFLSAWLITAYSHGQLRIAFGSCSQQQNEQLWDAVLATQPDLWIWLGDNIYADTHDMKRMRQMYDQQKQHPGYQRLRATTAIIGTWDDHDYGVNDGGRNYSQKAASKEEMLRFLDIPATDPVRMHEGVYSAHTYGKGNQKVKVILLDTRTFRDTLVKGTNGWRYGINPDGDVLGEAQWNWLEKELSHSDASVHIIGSSIQFIAEEHGWEKWSNFPAARSRMIALLQKTRPARAFILSGDRHIAEISQMPVDGLPHPLIDFTSSGLTHTWNDRFFEPNRYRAGKFMVARNFGLILINWKDGKPRVELQAHGKDSVLEQFVLPD